MTEPRILNRPRTAAPRILDRPRILPAPHPHPRPGGDR